MKVEQWTNVKERMKVERWMKVREWIESWIVQKTTLIRHPQSPPQRFQQPPRRTLHPHLPSCPRNPAPKE